MEDNSVMNKEQLDLLLAIKSTSESLRREVTGGVTFQDGDGVDLAESTSVKQILEEILFKLKAVSTNVEALSSKKTESLKLEEAKKMEDHRGKLFNGYPVVDIKFGGKPNWITFWMQEVEKLQQFLRILVDGSSLNGMTVLKLAKSIPRRIPSENVIGSISEWFPFLEMRSDPSNDDLLEDVYSQSFGLGPYSDLNRQAIDKLRSRKPAIIEICNYSDYQLQKPKLFLLSGKVFNKMPDTISSGKREVMSFFARSYEIGIGGLCSYDVSGANIKLAVKFECCLSVEMETPNYSSRWKYFCGLACTAKNVSVDAEMFNKKVSDLTTVDVDFQQDESPKIIQRDDLLAFLQVSEGADAVVFKIQVLKFVQEAAIPRLMKVVKKGFTFPTSGSFDWNNVFGDNVGCVIEIENRLNVPLNDFKWYIDVAKDYVLPPSSIAAFTSEMFYILDNITTKGMISMQIDNLELRMCVVFWTQPSGNQFSVGFISSSTKTDAATMDSLIISEPWKTRPYLFAQAVEGEQILEYLNLRLTAAMTTEAKASLKIIITAF